MSCFRETSLPVSACSLMCESRGRHRQFFCAAIACLVLLYGALDVRGQGGNSPLKHPVAQTLTRLCLDCHGADSTSGGLNLQSMLESFDPKHNVDQWVKVEHALVAGTMPPAGEVGLSDTQQMQFVDWFRSEFILPGGQPHPGPQNPRRLTREELQNTLEDLLHVNIRQTVTNSRLHVIPDTIIEKFFPPGVIGDSGFSNDAATLAQETIDVQTYSRCFSLVLSLLDQDESARTTLLGTPDVSAEISLDDARSVIRSFARRAWRREPAEAEVDVLCTVFRNVASGESGYAAMKTSFLAVLLSPSFLFRMEDDSDDESGDPDSARNTQRVSSRELAVRLAYFIWSAPPDTELWQHAADGSLQQTSVLRQQVRRMLADPRRIALAENLGGEWFDYRILRQQSAVNKRSDRMAGFYRTQYEEALLFFDSVIRYRQSLFRLVDAEWAFLNPHQRGIYRLTATPYEFEESNPLPPVNLHYRRNDRKIHVQNYEYKHAPLTAMKLTDRDRGGFVTLGSTLSVTSTANRTSPIRRGVWVMERILGRKFEVPEDVPDLETTKKKADAEQQELSMTELLQLHSSQDGCAVCHQYIDPVGFGLECFDQLGISRTITESNPSGEKLHWIPDLTPRQYGDMSWTVTEPLVPGKETRVFFQYTKGRHRLNVRNVRLASGTTIVKDDHFGFTGEAKKDNVWFFEIPADAPAGGWSLTAEIQGDGGTDSAGIITIAGPEDVPAGYELPNGNRFRSPAELKQQLLSDYREEIIDNAIRRVLGYALGRKALPVDRPAIAEIKRSIKDDGYRLIDLIEAVALSFPFRHRELP